MDKETVLLGEAIASITDQLANVEWLHEEQEKHLKDELEVCIVKLALHLKIDLEVYN